MKRVFQSISTLVEALHGYLDGSWLFHRTMAYLVERAPVSTLIGLSAYSFSIANKRAILLGDGLVFTRLCKGTRIRAHNECRDAEAEFDASQIEARAAKSLDPGIAELVTDGAWL